MPDESPEPKSRAPGKATANGRSTCPCTSWAQPIDTPNFTAATEGREELDHAPLCDGRGNPTRVTAE